jgi:hypothetical protein
VGCFSVGVCNKIKDIYNYIYCIPLFLLIIYREQIIFYIYTILISIRVLYNIDWNLFVEHYILDGSLLFMEGEGHKPSESLIGNQWHKPSEASTGNNTSLNRPGVYIRDDGSEISVSKNLIDWGVSHNYIFSLDPKYYPVHCSQMANLLEYQSKVYGQQYVDLWFDSNLVKKAEALEFFDEFVKRHNIQSEPMSAKVLNTVELRNLFRHQAKWPSI